jgi:hypothetical protein
MYACMRGLGKPEFACSEMETSRFPATRIFGLSAMFTAPATLVRMSTHCFYSLTCFVTDPQSLKNFFLTNFASCSTRKRPASRSFLDRIDTTVQTRRLHREYRTVERVFLQVGAVFSWTPRHDGCCDHVPPPPVTDNLPPQSHYFRQRTEASQDSNLIDSAQRGLGAGPQPSPARPSMDFR